jgi:hypothetical protein
MSTATSPLSSPSLFKSHSSKTQTSSSYHSLIRSETLARWASDIKSRQKRRRDKQRKEMKADERRRRSDSNAAFQFSSPPSYTNSFAVSAPISHPDVPRSSSFNRNLATPEPVFNFDDETNWAPLPSNSRPQQAKFTAGEDHSNISFSPEADHDIPIGALSSSLPATFLSSSAFPSDDNIQYSNSPSFPTLGLDPPTSPSSNPSFADVLSKSGDDGSGSQRRNGKKKKQVVVLMSSGSGRRAW